MARTRKKKVTILGVDKVPCKSCPYRKDVPSGVWAAEEYDKLPAYDRTTISGDDTYKDLIGRLKRFDCHQRNGKLCAGWVGCHGAKNLVALRLSMSLGAEVSEDVWDYKSPVPLWESGKAAAEHGKKHIEQPPEDAQRMVGTLTRKAKRDKWKR